MWHGDTIGKLFLTLDTSLHLSVFEVGVTVQINCMIIKLSKCVFALTPR